MARVDVTQSVVLQRVVARLRDQLSLDPRQCFESLQAESPPEIPPGGNYFLSVSPGSGQFWPEEQVAGNITEQWGVVVTGYARIQLDSVNHDDRILHDDVRGLLEIKHKILKSLCGHDLLTADGDTFLRQVLYATSAGQPQIGSPISNGQPRRDMYIGWISVAFGVDFDWDIT